MHVLVPLGSGEGECRAQRSVRPPAPVLQGFQGVVHYAELEATMQAAHNSSACIAAAACLPLGSHSVWCAVGVSRSQRSGWSSAACAGALHSHVSQTCEQTVLTQRRSSSFEADANSGSDCQGHRHEVLLWVKTHAVPALRVS